MSGIKEKLYNQIWLVILLIMAFIFYCHSMYANKPWYDELYTYYYFISRGPVYAAIHWPVPNNHMGYSVIAAVFDLILGNYWGLRGLSVVCSVLNVYLVYRLAYKLCKDDRLLIVGCYMGAYLTYSLAFQGRGYALITTCLLVALNVLCEICLKKDALYMYIVWICVLAWGLYTIASSTYWVIPVCLTGGSYLLITKQYKKLGRLIIASAIAAVITFFMYSVVWLAIGSNLLSKDASSAFYGIYQLNIIKSAPLKAWNRGMQYMLDTPYIQSIDRHEVITGLWGYFCSLFDQYYSYLHNSMGKVTCIVYILSLVTALTDSVVSFINGKKTSDALTKEETNDKKLCTERLLMIRVIVLIFGLCIPLMLIVQSVNPYLRVFSFFAAIIGFMAYYLLNRVMGLAERFFKREDSTCLIIRVGTGICIFFMALLANLIFSFGLTGKNGPYPIRLADRENDIYYSLEQQKDTVKNIDTIFYTDDFQKYVLKFYYDIEPVEVPLEEAGYIMMSEAFMSGSEQSDWPMLVIKDYFDIGYVYDNFTPLNEIEESKKAGSHNPYILYRRK